MAYSANMLTTTGSGQAGTNGSAGSTRIRAVTRPGAALASSSEIIPPIELPIRITGPPATASMKSCSRDRLAVTSVLRPAARVRPCPARSGARTR